MCTHTYTCNPLYADGEANGTLEIDNNEIEICTTGEMKEGYNDKEDGMCNLYSSLDTCTFIDYKYIVCYV